MMFYRKNYRCQEKDILLSSNDTCVMCHSKLLVQKDRHASIVIYDDRMGTVHGTHFHKYCTVFVDIFTTMDTIPQERHPSVLKSFLRMIRNQLFVSSHETAFSLNLLKRFNSEILFGQMSFKQCAEVYNHLQHNNLNASGQQ